MHSTSSPLVILLLLAAFSPSLLHLCGAVSATGAVYECWHWASYDICVVADAASGICPAAFDQYAYSNLATARNTFFYYLDQYADAKGFTAEFWLRQIFAPTDPGYATYLDATYNTSCATDTGVAALLTTNTTDGSAIDSRTSYTYVLRGANFCGPNEMPIPLSGCECMAGKNCNDLKAEGAREGLAALLGSSVVLLILVLWGGTILVRSAWTVQSGWSSLVDNLENEIKRVMPPGVSASIGSYLSHPMSGHTFRPGGGDANVHVKLRTAAPSAVPPSRPRPAHVTEAEPSPSTAEPHAAQPINSESTLPAPPQRRPGARRYVEPTSGTFGSM